MMRPFSPRMFPMAATLLSLSESVDRVAGLVQSYAAGTASLPCRLRLRGSRPGMSAVAETGVTPCDLAFPADPGARVGDVFLVGTRRVRAVAPAQARGADSVLFVVAGEVID